MSASESAVQLEDRPSLKNARGPRWRLVLSGVLLIFLLCGGWVVRANRHRQSGLQETEVAGLYADTRLINFDSAQPGTQIHGSFHLTNRGSANLDILGVTTDCGCTVAHIPIQTLTTLGSVEVRFSVSLPADTADALVSRKLVVNVRTGGREQTVVLRIAANLPTKLRLMAIPGRVDFGTVAPGAHLSKEVFLRGPRKAVGLLPAELAVRANADNRITIAAETDDSVLVYRSVRLVLDVPTLPPGILITSTAQIEFTGSTPMQLIMPIRARVGTGSPVSDRSAGAQTATHDPATAAQVAKEKP